MPYIALKPCRFDKPYFIGDVVPDEVVDKGREKSLINEMGVLAKTRHELLKPLGDEGGDKTDNETQTEGESDSQTAQDGTSSETVQGKLTPAEIKRLNKAELTALAASYGLDVSGLTNVQIAEAIIYTQGE